MSPYPSQLLSVIIFLLTGLNVGCEDPPHLPRPSVVSTKQPLMVSAELPSTQKIQEVDLEPMVIIGHVIGDTESVLGVVSDESEDAACKIAGDFLVVPVLTQPSTYLNCEEQSDALYIMKLKNCTEQKIVFTAFTFTVTLSSNQEAVLKNGLVDEFIQFELHLDHDHSSHVTNLNSLDSKTGTLPFAGVDIEVEGGEDQFCRLKVVRKCSNNSDQLEFNLDLTGAWASKVLEDSVLGVDVNGAVFDRPDRQIIFMSSRK